MVTMNSASNVPGHVGTDLFPGFKDTASVLGKTREALPATGAALSSNHSSTLSSNQSSTVEYRASYFEQYEYRSHKVFKRAMYSNETLMQFQSKTKAAQTTHTPALSGLSLPLQNDRQTPSVTAKNILNFVEQRLNKSAAAGATPDDLGSLLQQAQTGIDTGYEQARKDLGQLGLLTPELSEEIDQSYALAMEGLAALKVKFGLAAPSPAPSNQASPVAASQSPAAPKVVAQPTDANSRTHQNKTVSANSAMESSRINYKSGMSGSLMITTRDGDKVYLNETLIDVFRQKSVTAHDGSTYSRFMSASQYTQELTVIGSLDEDEMAAIQDLVDKASDIADLMQGRDFQAALESAMALDFDESEIAGFALQLTRAEVFSSKSVVYKKPSPLNAFAPAFAALSKKTSEVTSLLDQLKVSNQDFAAFIAQINAKKPLHADSPGYSSVNSSANSSAKQVHAFQSITKELLNLHRTASGFNL